MERTGALLVNLGTPSAPDAGAVRRYLVEFLSDPRVVDAPRWFWLPLLWGVIAPIRSLELGPQLPQGLAARGLSAQGAERAAPRGPGPGTRGERGRDAPGHALRRAIGGPGAGGPGPGFAPGGAATVPPVLWDYHGGCFRRSCQRVARRSAHSRAPFRTRILRRTGLSRGTRLLGARAPGGARRPRPSGLLVPRHPRALRPCGRSLRGAVRAYGAGAPGTAGPRARRVLAQLPVACRTRALGWGPTRIAPGRAGPCRRARASP
jgi:hypothetical protein